MEITEQYAVLILDASFKTTILLSKIRDSAPGSPERMRYEAELEAIKEWLREHIEQTREEIVEAFRKNKAAQLLLEIEGEEE